MLTKDERFQLRRLRNRPHASVSISLPQDVIQTLDDFAPALGFEDHLGLIRVFISEGMRKYEERAYAFHEEQDKRAARVESSDLSKQAS